MESIKSILPAMLEKAGLKKRFSIESVILHWPEIIGAEIAANARPTAYQRGVLMVTVKNPVWSHHLFTIRESIILKINSYAGGKLVHDIKFFAGNFQNDPNNENTKENLPISRLIRDIQLNDEDVLKARQAAGLIADQDLRERVYKVLLKETAFRKWKEKDGWQRCVRCGTLCSGGLRFCTVCGREKKYETIAALKQILKEAPWLSFDECLNYNQCSMDEYRQARTELISAFSMSLDQENPDPICLASIAMLILRLKPHEINEAVLKNTLARIRRKKHVSSFRI